MKPAAPNPSLALVKLCCRVLDEKKAEDVRVLDVSAQSSITNFLIVATATSEPHVRALRVELEIALDAAGVRIVGIETAKESGWTVVDVFDVMIHLFLAESRSKYRLESLWKDASQVPVGKLLARKVRSKVKSKATKAKKKSPRRNRETR